MPAITIGRMAKLYGLHRSTLHEAVAKGRITAGHDGKGQRVIDLSEMIRIYGEPVGRPTPSPDTSVSVPTPSPDSSPTSPDTPVGWADMVVELRLLREEVAGLRQELRLIEHKPTEVQIEKVATPTTAVERLRPGSFADLLAGLDQA